VLRAGAGITLTMSSSKNDAYQVSIMECDEFENQITPFAQLAAATQHR
jgi:hypothetical protein